MSDPETPEHPDAGTGDPLHPSTGPRAPERWWRTGGTGRQDVRTTLALHERFGREATVALSRLARCEIELRVVVSEWMSYGEYIANLDSNVTLAVVELPGVHGYMLVGTETATGLRVIDRLLGGSGANPPQRGPTELELELLGEVLTGPVSAVGEVFGGALQGQPQVVQLSTQPELLNLVVPTESVLVISYSVRMDLGAEVEGQLKLCYMPAAIDQLLSTVGTPATATAEVPENPLVREMVHDVEMHLVARLQPSSVPAEDLQQLQVGDVLILDHHRDHAINLLIGDAVVLDGALGRRGRTVAVQVQRWRIEPKNLMKELTQ